MRLTLWTLFGFALLFGSNGNSTPPEGSPYQEVLENDVLYIETIGTLGASKRKLVRWEDGILPLKFDKKFSKNQKAEFMRLCNEWSQVANVRCLEGKYKGRQVQVTGKSDWGCFAVWGMGTHFVVVKHRMNLAPGCWNRRTLLHEMGHAFGLIHEHQRPDRDQHIRIVEKNLKKGFLGLDKKINYDSESADVHTEYDLLSIMHYHSTAGSKNKKETIQVLPPKEHLQRLMGRLDMITEFDARAMAALYGPPVVEPVFP